MNIRLAGPVVNKALPSGSGMTWSAGRYFVVGDDSPYLFTLNRKFAITARSLLRDYPIQQNGRIAKAIKPDYEAMASVVWNGTVWNLILSSGSDKETRGAGLLVSTDGKATVHERDMTVLYRDFASLAGFKTGQLVNIEAVAVARDVAYFFNRGNANRNILFKVPLGDLLTYMTGEADKVAGIRLHEAALPQLNGREAGFSGADYWPEIDSLVYSASVEGAYGAYDDGAVLGSYLGLIPLPTLEEGALLDLTRSAQRLSKVGVPLKTKVESISLTHTERRRAVGALVADNDNGSSEFFDVVLTIAPRR
ncbi:DUF6929 family protein [Variovorax ginsengisoli]|uniref:Uncharacterized protein n=1 Tax=Variovorax ginsengisoli TaxID=363844 RepID=A0ABT8SK49_9BURK|nr:hypothetical protein [Variovorax ginsengisoli]MDN8618781.1 hypothetical protein [Variovorax ginsengisoli]MDO1537951.1 hypothetical protein [Variovorax ginsengisoli]